MAPNHFFAYRRAAVHDIELVPSRRRVGIQNEWSSKIRNGGTRAVASAEVTMDHPLWFPAMTARDAPTDEICSLLRVALQLIAFVQG